MAKRVEELQVWQRARKLAVAITARTSAPAFASRPRLAEQLDDAIDSVLSNIGEGFGQPTDRAFARYLAIARGSCNEVRAHLTLAEIRGCIPSEECQRLQEEADEICRMLTGFRHYLLACDRKERC